MPTFGEFVREQRLRQKLTQRQVAEALGLKSVAYWSDVEAGNRRPSKGLLPALARVLKVTPEDLAAVDTRAPVESLRLHLQRHPDSAVALNQILAHARTLGFDEILRRIEHPAPAPGPGQTSRPARRRPTTELFPDPAD